MNILDSVLSSVPGEWLSSVSELCSNPSLVSFGVSVGLHQVPEIIVSNVSQRLTSMKICFIWCSNPSWAQFHIFIKIMLSWYAFLIGVFLNAERIVNQSLCPTPALPEDCVWLVKTWQRQPSLHSNQVNNFLAAKWVVGLILFITHKSNMFFGCRGVTHYHSPHNNCIPLKALLICIMCFTPK